MSNNKQLIPIDSYKKSKNIDSNLKKNHAPKKFRKIKTILIYIILTFILFTVGFSYVYFTPTSFVIVDVNTSINISTNRWNKIISASSLNYKGQKILNEINIKYKNIDDGLTLILSDAESNNYINSTSKKDSAKEISVLISGNSLELPVFTKTVKNRNFYLQINNNGESQ
ncbi:MAG: hypothetical protein PHX70_03395 [Clostridium sp.]|nr:hypothetical protein [Clostridium sp.]